MHSAGERSQPYGVDLSSGAADRRNLWYGAPGCDDTKRSSDEIRIIRDMTFQEVDVFLQGSAIDSAAQKELRNEAPHVQLAVLERGPLRACTNPSGALVARIRDAKRGILGDKGGGRHGGAPAMRVALPDANELDKFCADNRVDQAAVASMRCETQEVRTAVMARGPLVNTTNPSASLMARIRTVKQEGQSGANTSTPGLVPPAPPMSLTSLIAASSMPGVMPPAPPLALPAPPLADGALNGEALRAIQKLSAQQLEAADAMATHPAGGSEIGQPAGGSSWN